MELTDILDEGSVVVCPNINDKRELLEFLSKIGAEHTGQQTNVVFDAVMAREELGSTGLGNGIAIPHGKFVGLHKVVAVFARLLEPIEFDSVDDQPVDLVVMLLAPQGAGADHLKALARVARLLRTESVVEALRSTTDEAKLYAILTERVAATYAA
jgi:PTS system nitrogen regulatory IIA component